MGIGVVTMSGLSGLVGSLSKFQADLRRLPTVVAQRVAAESAGTITRLVEQTFSASENAYGIGWAPGAEGQKVTLRKSVALARGLVYVATGTRIRLKLAVKYAKYQVGKRPVAPSQGAPLPLAYATALSRTAIAICRAELGR